MPFQRGDTWYTDIKLKSGRHRHPIIGCTNKTMALDYEAKLRREEFNEDVYGIKNEISILFKDFIKDEYLPRHAGDFGESAQVGLRVLGRFFDNIAMDKISWNLVDQFRKEAGKTAPIGVNRYLSLLHTVFARAAHWNKKRTGQEKKWKLPAYNPVDEDIKKAPEAPRRKAASEDEIKRIIANTEDSRNPKMRDIILLALLTGMRKGEIQKMSKKDWDFAHNSIILWGTKGIKLRRRKGRKCDDYETVPMSPLVRNILEKYVAMHDTTPFNFNFKKAFARVLKYAAVEGLHFHDLRRTCSTIMCALGVSLEIRAKILRHAVPEFKMTADVYTAMSDEQLREAVGKLDHYFATRILQNVTTRTLAENEPKMVEKQNGVSIAEPYVYNSWAISSAG